MELVLKNPFLLEKSTEYFFNFCRGVDLAKMLGGPQCHNEEVTSFKMPQTRAFYIY